MIKKGIVQEEKVIQEIFAFPFRWVITRLRVVDANVIINIDQTNSLFAIWCPSMKMPALSIVGIIFLISFSMECLIMKFGQKAEISLEGILELGILIILPS